MTGHEYQLYLSEPPLYIIRKVDRKSQTEGAKTLFAYFLHSIIYLFSFQVIELAYYYILNGIVYQSPDFLSVVSSRVQTSISHLQDGIETSKYFKYKKFKRSFD